MRIHLRLVDPNGYDTATRTVPADQADATERQLLTEDAPADLAAWGAGHPEYRLSSYRVIRTPIAS